MAEIIGLEKKRVIVGLGKTGLSCAKYLSMMNENFLVMDSRETPPCLAELKRQLPEVKVHLGKFDEKILGLAKEIIVSPGVDLKTPEIKKARKKGVRITGDIDIFTKVNKVPVIAVTGSNGKSTVVSLLGEMAKKAGLKYEVAGNIGKPVLELLMEGLKELYILELSSFQLETTENMHAEVAGILNISPDHMDRYETLEEYQKAKNRIFNNCKNVAVNKEDILTIPINKNKSKVLVYGKKHVEGLEFGVKQHKNKKYIMFNEQALIPVEEIKIAGEHNILNSIAALTMGYAAGIKIEPMINALKEFSGLKHRCQWVAEKNSVNYYNDSKGTNVGASIAAIKGLKNKIKKDSKLLLIAGGVGKGADFLDLAMAMEESNCLAILFGKDAGLIEKVLNKKIPVIQVKDMNEAVKEASLKSKPGDIVLMSPACASFDMFKNYEVRGDAFIDAVMRVH